MGTAKRKTINASIKIDVDAIHPDADGETVAAAVDRHLAAVRGDLLTKVHDELDARRQKAAQS